MKIPLILHVCVSSSINHIVYVFIFIYWFGYVYILILRYFRSYCAKKFFKKNHIFNLLYYIQ